MKCSSLIYMYLLTISYDVMHINAAESKNCVAYFGTCNEDCECCGWEKDKSIRCELRNPFKGTRCHISRNNGEHCEYDRHCKSHKCVDGKCDPVLRPIKDPVLCELNITDADPIKGEVVPPDNGICPCPDPIEATKENALLAIDGDLSTAYVNNYALSSGLQFHADPNAPLYNMTLCSADTCAECDPTCYKLVGYCEEKNLYRDIQEGKISFSKRNECIVIPIKARAYYSQYLVTFPCQRGGFPECSITPATCECANGLKPFEPEPTRKGKCNGLEPVSKTRRSALARRLSQQISYNPRRQVLPPQIQTRINGEHTRITAEDRTTLSFKSAKKVGDITEIVYMVRNVARFDTNFHYAMIQWGGDCCFECYKAYMDTPTNGILDDGDEECHEDCKSQSDLEKLLFSEKDEHLCMQGLQLKNFNINGDKNYFFKVKVHGDVTMEMKPYGMSFGLFGDSILYGDIESPVCHVCGEGGGQQCKDYPLQIAEVSLSARCKDLPRPTKYPFLDYSVTGM